MGLLAAHYEGSGFLTPGFHSCPVPTVCPTLPGPCHVALWEVGLREPKEGIDDTPAAVAAASSKMFFIFDPVDSFFFFNLPAFLKLAG